jgi:predicted small lipoprotein YifL
MVQSREGEGLELNSPSDRRLGWIAAIGALACALGLAGCGRKAGLDPPPAAQASAAEITTGEPPAAQPGVNDPDKLPQPQTAPRRRLPIDFLID